MEIILLEDVANLGKKYDTVEVADGYGRNYLLPEGKARVATDRAQAQLKEQKRQVKERREAKRKELKDKLADIDGVVITLARKANEQGHLFAGVDAGDIATAINEEHDIEIPAEYVELSAPIKEVGEHTVTITIEEESAHITVDIKSNS